MSFSISASEAGAGDIKAADPENQPLGNPADPNPAGGIPSFNVSGKKASKEDEKATVVLTKEAEKKSNENKKKSFKWWILGIILGIVAFIVVVLTAGIALVAYFIVMGVKNHKKTMIEMIRDTEIKFLYKTEFDKQAILGLAKELRETKILMPIRTIVITVDNKFDSFDDDNLYLVPSLSSDVMLYAFAQTSILASLKLNTETTAKLIRFAERYITNTEESTLKQFVAIANSIVVMKSRYPDLEGFLVTETERKIYVNLDSVDRFLADTHLDILRM